MSTLLGMYLQSDISWMHFLVLWQTPNCSDLSKWWSSRRRLPQQGRLRNLWLQAKAESFPLQICKAKETRNRGRHFLGMQAGKGPLLHLQIVIKATQTVEEVEKVLKQLEEVSGAQTLLVCFLLFFFNVGPLGLQYTLVRFFLCNIQQQFYLFEDI